MEIVWTIGRFDVVGVGADDEDAAGTIDAWAASHTGGRKP